jgi:hypothetical protein
MNSIYGIADQHAANLSGNIGLENQAMARAPQVATHLEVLAKELGALDDSILRLSNKIAPILSVVPPNGTAVGLSPNAPTAPLASRIAEISRTIASHTLAIQSLIDRVEV